MKDPVKKKTYLVGGDVIEIEDSKLSEFQEFNPVPVDLVSIDGGKSYNYVRKENLQNVLKKHPGAVIKGMDDAPVTQRPADAPKRVVQAPENISGASSEYQKQLRQKNFVKRMYDPKLSISNPDGSTSTHKMASAEVDGKQIAFPTIVEKSGKLVELPINEAIDFALKNNEYAEFAKPEEAQAWAEGGYKKGTPLEEKTQSEPKTVFKKNGPTLTQLPKKPVSSVKKIPLDVAIEQERLKQRRSGVSMLASDKVDIMSSNYDEGAYQMAVKEYEDIKKYYETSLKNPRYKSEEDRVKAQNDAYNKMKQLEGLKDGKFPLAGLMTGDRKPAVDYYLGAGQREANLQKAGSYKAWSESMKKFQGDKFIPEEYKEEYAATKNYEAVINEYDMWLSENNGTGNYVTEKVKWQDKLNNAEKVLKLQQKKSNLQVEKKIQDATLKIAGLKTLKASGRTIPGMDVDKMISDVEQERDVLSQSQQLVRLIEAGNTEAVESALETQNVPGKTAEERLSNYFSAMLLADQKHAPTYEWGGDTESSAVGAFWRNMSSPSQERQGFYELRKELKAIAPIVMLRRTPVNETDNAIEVFGKTFIQEFVPASNLKISTAQQVASKTQEVLEYLSGDIENPQQGKTMKDIAAPYENFSSKDWAQMAATTTAIMGDMVLASPVTGAAMKFTKLGRFVNQSAETGRMMEGTKFFDTLAGNKFGRGFTRAAFSGLKEGVNFEIAGDIFDTQEDELNFWSGFFGGVVSSPISQVVNKFGKEAVMKQMARVFGSETVAAQQLIYNYGSLISQAGQLTGRGVAEVAEEYGNELGNIYRESDSWKQFSEKLDERFGDSSDNFHFAVSSYVMGFGMGLANSVGQMSMAKSKMFYSQLDEEEKANFNEMLREMSGEIDDITTEVEEEESETMESDGVTPTGQNTSQQPMPEAEGEVPVPVAVNGDENQKKQRESGQQLLQELSANSDLHLNPDAIIDGTWDGDHRGAGSETLEIDDDGNVVLRRAASDEDHLVKRGKESSGKQDLYDTSLSNGGGNGVPTASSNINSEGEYGHRDYAVTGEFRIPMAEFTALVKSGEIVLGNIGEREIVISPRVAQQYVTNVKNKNNVAPAEIEIEQQVDAPPRDIVEFATPLGEVRDAYDTDGVRVVSDDVKMTLNNNPEGDIVVENLSPKKKTQNAFEKALSGLVDRAIESGKKIVIDPSVATSVVNQDTLGMALLASGFTANEGGTYSRNPEAKPKLPGYTNEDGDNFNYEDGKLVVRNKYGATYDDTRAKRRVIDNKSAVLQHARDNKLIPEGMSEEEFVGNKVAKSLAQKAEDEKVNALIGLKNMYNGMSLSGKQTDIGQKTFAKINKRAGELGFDVMAGMQGSVTLQKDGKKVAMRNVSKESFGKPKLRRTLLSMANIGDFGSYGKAIAYFLSGNKLNAKGGELAGEEELFAAQRRGLIDRFSDKENAVDNVAQFDFGDDLSPREQEQMVKDLQDVLNSFETKEQMWNYLEDTYKRNNENQNVNPEEQLNEDIDENENEISPSELDGDEEFSPGGEDAPFSRASKKKFQTIERLKKLADIISKTGLALSIVYDQEEFNAKWKEIGDSGKVPDGFVVDGVVYINPAIVKTDTLIHEFGHLWQQWAKQSSPALYRRAMTMIRASQYFKDVRNDPNYAHLTTEEQIMDEAMARAIGDAGARIEDYTARQKFLRWLQNLFRYVGQTMGLDGRFFENADRMTIEQLSEAIARAMTGDISSLLDGDEYSPLGQMVSMSISGDNVNGRKAMPDVVNGFYSPLEKIIGETKADKLPAKQWIEKFAKGEEAKWTGLTQWLNTQSGSLTKQQVLEHLQNNRIEIVEVVRTDNVLDRKHFDANQTANGDWDVTYKGKLVDVFLKEDGIITKDDAIDEAIRIADPDTVYEEQQGSGNTKYQQYQLPGEKSNYKEVLVTLPREDVDFESSHFTEPNILVHLRVNTRIDSEGKKVLFIEEIQSDWGQEGKKKGFAKKPDYALMTNEQLAKEYEQQIGYNPFEEGEKRETVIKILSDKANPSNGVDEAPYITDTNSWVKLGLKVAMKEAVKQGVDKIAWSTGTQQFERWGSEEIHWNKFSDTTWEVSINEQTEGAQAFNGNEQALRNNRLEEKGIKVRTKEDLTKAIKNNLSRERNDTEIEKLTDRIWNRMQVEESGTSLPRKEGMEAFYGSSLEGNKGIVGSVAEKLFGQKVGLADIKTTEGRTKINSQNSFFTTIDGVAVSDPTVDEQGFDDLVDPVKYWGERGVSESVVLQSLESVKRTAAVGKQYSANITPEIIQQVQQGLPLMSRSSDGNQDLFGDADETQAGKTRRRFDRTMEHFSQSDILQGLVRRNRSFYDKESNEEALEKARTYIERNGAAAAYDNVTNPESKLRLEEVSIQTVRFILIDTFSEAIAAAMEMGDGALASDLTTKLSNLVETTVKQATLYGRESQRLSIWKQMNPLAVAYRFEELINQHNQQVTEAIGIDPVVIDVMASRLQAAAQEIADLKIKLADQLDKNDKLRNAVDRLSRQRIADDPADQQVPQGAAGRPARKTNRKNRVDAEQDTEGKQMINAAVARLQARKGTNQRNIPFSASISGWSDEDIQDLGEIALGFAKRGYYSSRAIAEEVYKTYVDFVGFAGTVEEIQDALDQSGDWKKEQQKQLEKKYKASAIGLMGEIKDIVKDFYANDRLQNMKESLRDKLIAELGLSETDADSLAVIIEEDINSKAKKAAEQTIRRNVGTETLPSSDKKKGTMIDHLVDTLLSTQFSGDMNFYVNTLMEYYGASQLTPLQSQQLVNLARNVRAQEQGSIFYSSAVKAMADFMIQHSPDAYSLFDAWIELYYASMLSGLATSVLNVTSVATNEATMFLQDLTNISAHVSRWKNRSNKSPLGLALLPGFIVRALGGIQGFTEAKSRFKDVWANGSNYSKYIDHIAGTKGLGVRELEKRKYKYGRFWGKYNPFNSYKYSPRNLEAQDTFSRTLIEQRYFAEVVRKKLISEGLGSKKMNDFFDVVRGKTVDMAVINKAVDVESKRFEALSGTKLSENQKAIRRNELVRQEKATQLGLSQDDLQNIVHAADIAVFTGKRNGVVGHIATIMGRSMSRNKLFKLATLPWIPFVNVVGNVFEFMVDASPLYGFARVYGLSPSGLYARMQAARNNEKGAFSFDFFSDKTAQAGESGSIAREKQLGRAWFGTAAFVAIAMMFLPDEDDDDPTDNPYRIRGGQDYGNPDDPPYTMWINGVPISYINIPVLAVPLSLIGNYSDRSFSDARLDNEDRNTRLSLAMMSIYDEKNLILDMSFMEGVQRLFGFMADVSERVDAKEGVALKEKDSGSSFIAREAMEYYFGILTKPLPQNTAMIKQIERAFDPASYSRKDVEGVLMYTMGVERFSFANQQKSLDLFGDPVTYLPGENFLAISHYLGIKGGDKRWEFLQKFGAVPQKAKNLPVDINDTQRTFTSEEWYAVTKIAGIDYSEWVMQKAGNEGWQKQNNDEYTDRYGRKVTRLQDASFNEYSSAYKSARKEVVRWIENGTFEQNFKNLPK